MFEYERVLPTYVAKNLATLWFSKEPVRNWCVAWWLVLTALVNLCMYNGLLKPKALNCRQNENNGNSLG